MTPILESLLEHRLLIVTGKGGTGKTSVAAALGLMAAQRGRETAVVEVGDEPELSQPVAVGPRLSTLRIVPQLAFEEYLGLQLRVKRLAHALVHNPAFQRLLEAAPGWRELITLGKIWHRSSQQVGGRPRWELIVVDAPSTGYGLSFLSVPGVVLEAVRIGPLRRHTERVQDLLQDPERTLILPVTLAEELPIKETLELCEQLRSLGLASGPLIANAVESEPALDDVDAVLEGLADVLNAEAPTPLVDPGALSWALRQRTRRAAMQRRFLAELDARSGLAHLELPYLTEGIDGPAGVARLARALGNAAPVGHEP